MTKYYIVLLSVFLFSGTLSAQKHSSAFDSIYYRIYTANRDLARRTQTADSLYRASGNDVQKVRSLMLLASMYRRSKKRKEVPGISYTGPGAGRRGAVIRIAGQGMRGLVQPIQESRPAVLR